MEKMRASLPMDREQQMQEHPGGVGLGGARADSQEPGGFQPHSPPGKLQKSAPGALRAALAS